MWKLYSSSNEAVCIKTSCGKIAAQLPEGAKFGKVRYIDFEAIKRPAGQISYDPAFLKRHSFEHEKEVRIVLLDIASPDAQQKKLEELIVPNSIGKTIPIRLEGLVEGVAIHPLSRDWFADIVEDVTRKYGFNFQISKSRLAEKPVY